MYWVKWRKRGAVVCRLFYTRERAVRFVRLMGEYAPNLLDSTSV